jgi:hypothetical protein
VAGGRWSPKRGVVAILRGVEQHGDRVTSRHGAASDRAATAGEAADWDPVTTARAALEGFGTFAGLL